MIVTLVDWYYSERNNKQAGAIGGYKPKYSGMKYPRFTGSNELRKNLPIDAKNLPGPSTMTACLYNPADPTFL